MEYIKVYDNVLDEILCNNIIHHFIDNEKKQYNGVVGKNAILNLSFKNCKELVFEIKKDLDLLHNILHKYYLEYSNNIKYIKSIYLVDEPWRIKKYVKNEGLFDWHVDAAPTHKSRLFSVIFYLNDVSEGGETSIMIDGKIKNIQPKRGSLLIFPSNFIYIHKGNIPISNDKYIISTFLNMIDLQ